MTIDCNKLYLWILSWFGEKEELCSCGHAIKKQK